MRILMVNGYPLGQSGSGGAEGHVATLCTLLREAGHEPAVLTGQVRSRAEQRSPGHHCLPGLGDPPLRRRLVSHLRLRQSALQKVRDVVAAERPDVIHVHNLYDAAALRLLRGLAPTVKSIHDCRPFCNKPRPAVASRLVGDSDRFCGITFGRACWGRCYAHAGSNTRERLEAWSLFPNNLAALNEVRRCDRVLVSSSYLRELALAAGTLPERIEELHYFSDLEPAAELPHREPDPPTVVFSGRLVYEKGVGLLLEALERIPAGPAFETRIVGSGPLEPQVREAAARAPAHRPIRLLGYLDRRQMQEQLLEASMLVFPSIGSEGCPQAGLEAMYCGVPVVGFDVGGVPEWLVDHQTGLRVARGDVPGLAAAMHTLLADAGLRARLGKGARDYVRVKFRSDKYLSGLLEIYRSVLGQTPPPATTTTEPQP